jgi:hypothetical protein
MHVRGNTYVQISEYTCKQAHCYQPRTKSLLRQNDISYYVLTTAQMFQIWVALFQAVKFLKDEHT